MNRYLRPLVCLIATLTAPCQLTRAQTSGTPIGSNTVQTDFRYRMMVSAGIDGYPNDDDVAAIGRYLTAAGDEGVEVPEDIARWILSKIGLEGPNAQPCLISPYMHFLRKSAVTPPFDPGAPRSSRYRLLTAMENDLLEHDSPVSGLALAMFREVDDQDLRGVANAAQYRALKSYPWMIGHKDWTDWILVGLNPESPDSPDTVQRAPGFPVVTDRAKAGLLPNVRSFVAGLDIRPPVSVATMSFREFTDDGPRSWGNIKSGLATRSSDNREMYEQEIALAKMLSPRIAETLGVPALDEQLIQRAADSFYQFGAVPTEGLNGMYRRSLGLGEPGWDRFTRLYHVLLLQQARLLALASYALVVHQRRDHLLVSDIAMDKIFSRLVSTDLPSQEKKTELVATLSPSQLADAAGADLAAITRCKCTSASVVRRAVSLHDHTYFETIRATCADGKSLQFGRAGVLSTDFLRMLELNPNFLDMADVSLAMRDLVNSASEYQDNPQDIDLIRANPELATALNLGVLAHSEVPWKYVRATLLQDWPISIEWLIPYWSPRPELRGFPPPPVVLLDQDKFEVTKSGYLAPEMNLLQYEARKRYIDGITPTVNALPETITVCSPTPNGGTQCPTYDSGKHTIMQQVNSIIDDKNQYARTAREVHRLSDPQCTFQKPHTAFLQVAINEKTNEFVSHYVEGVCQGAAQGQFPLSGAASEALQRALKQDPIFLNRYQLDLLDSTDDWKDRIGIALAYASWEAEHANQALRYLQSTDLLFYLPSIPAPRTKVDATAIYASGYQSKFFREHYWSNTSARSRKDLTLEDQSPIDAMTAPLMTSQMGMDLAHDLAELQLLAANVLPRAPEFTPSSLSESFIERLRDEERQALASVDQKADAQVQATKSLLTSSPTTTGLSVGFSLSIGAGVVPGFYFSYGGVGISVSLNLPSTVMVIPTLAPFQISDLPLVFPGSQALGPIWPSLSIPLSPNANTASPAAAPTNVPAAHSQAVRELQLSGPSRSSSADNTVISAQAPSNTITITTGNPGTISDIDASFANINWQTLLWANNYAGRIWLLNEISIAQPLLTPDQQRLIDESLKQATFPESLAKLIAADAAQASAQGGKLFEAASFGQILEAACTKSTWSNCGVAIKQALDKKPANPKDIVNLALLWASAYGARFDELRRKGHLEKSTPDSGKVSDAVESKIDPVDFAEDTADEAILKAVLGKLAFLVEFFNSDALNAFFNSSEIKSDYDELQLMDRILQKQITQQLEPYMKADWREQLKQAIGQTQWMKP